MTASFTVAHRLHNELAALRRLEAHAGGHLRINPDITLRHYTIDITGVRAPVVDGEGYRIAEVHHLTLDLPDDFPESPPVLRLDEPVLAVNCFENGVLCLAFGTWVPATRLDRLLCDVLDLIQNVRPNWGSIANDEAARLWRDEERAAHLRRALGPPVRLTPPVDELTRAESGVSGGIRSLRPGGTPVAGALRSLVQPPTAAGGGIRSLTPTLQPAAIPIRSLPSLASAARSVTGVAAEHVRRGA